MAVNNSCLHWAQHDEIDGTDYLQHMLVGKKASRGSSGEERSSSSYWQNGLEEEQAESSGQEDVEGAKH